MSVHLPRSRDQMLKEGILHRLKALHAIGEDFRSAMTEMEVAERVLSPSEKINWL